MPWMMGFMTLSTALRGEDGTAPKWIRKLQEAVWISMWKAYDSGYKKIFGDGERTVEDGDWEPSGGCWEKAVNGKETV